MVGAIVAVAVLVTGVIVALRWSSGSGPDSTAECTVPAVSGAPVTVVVEGPQQSGAGAAGTAELGASPAPSTYVTTAPEVDLDAVQLQHASTINAVGLHRKVPERARIIAVATAWQESKLRNLPGGDRDSIGLFQQRPSQGWGDPQQLADPVYAAGKFYEELLKVPGWQSMSLTMAAQEVQYSAFPDAYAQWEPGATTLVRALSGQPALEPTCRAGAQPSTATPPARTPLPGTGSADARLSGLLAAGQAELGGLQLVSLTADHLTATVRVGDATAGRALAAWTVAHATGFSVTQVVAGDRAWRDHGWLDSGAGGADLVTITVG